MLTSLPQRRATATRRREGGTRSRWRDRAVTWHVHPEIGTSGDRSPLPFVRVTHRHTATTRRRGPFQSMDGSGNGGLDAKELQQARNNTHTTDCPSGALGGARARGRAGDDCRAPSSCRRARRGPRGTQRRGARELGRRWGARSRPHARARQRARAEPAEGGGLTARRRGGSDALETTTPASSSDARAVAR